MTTLSRRLQLIMAEMDIDATELSAKTGITRSSLYHYISGRYTPKYDRIQQLAKVLRVSPDWLIGKTDDRLGKPNYSGLDTNPEFVEVPIVGQIACGSPILAEDNITGMALAPVSFRGCFALRCKGDSMKDARILDGDMVYIRPQPDVEDGQIAAVRVENEATLKKVYRYPGGVVVLRPANADYPDQIYTAEQFLDVQIIGLAVGFSSRIK